MLTKICLLALAVAPASAVLRLPSTAECATQWTGATMRSWMGSYDQVTFMRGDWQQKMNEATNAQEAELVARNAVFCSGTLVTNSHIVTAASCFVDMAALDNGAFKLRNQDAHAAVGSFLLNDPANARGLFNNLEGPFGGNGLHYPQRQRVVDITIHPSVNPLNAESGEYTDLAVVRVAYPFTMTDVSSPTRAGRVQPAIIDNPLLAAISDLAHPFVRYTDGSNNPFRYWMSGTGMPLATGLGNTKWSQNYEGLLPFLTECSSGNIDQQCIEYEGLRSHNGAACGGSGDLDVWVRPCGGDIGGGIYYKAKPDGRFQFTEGLDSDPQRFGGDTRPETNILAGIYVGWNRDTPTSDDSGATESGANACMPANDLTENGDVNQAHFVMLFDHGPWIQEAVGTVLPAFPVSEASSPDLVGIRRAAMNNAVFPPQDRRNPANSPASCMNAGACDYKNGKSVKQKNFCWCDPECVTRGDCCFDYLEAVNMDMCDTQPMAVNRNASCKGMCDHQSSGAGSSTSRNCWCDAACFEHDDCCNDYVVECSHIGDGYSCNNECGGKSKYCWCDSGCEENGDCCKDYSNVCQGHLNYDNVKVGGSCRGNCGLSAGQCWCDPYCATAGDCCVDFGAECAI